MLDIARGGRDDLVREFGVSRRLALRVTVLREKGLDCTATVVEEAGDDPVLESLLLHKRLIAGDVDPASALQELLSDPEFASLEDDMPVRVVERNGRRVLALEEEILAEELGADEDDDASDAEDAPDSAGDETTALATRATAADEPAPDRRADGPDGETSFTPERIEELRIAVFAGSTTAERVSALRRLCFAPVETEDLMRIFIQALGESDRQLRSAAAAGLRSLGLQHDVAEGLRLLAEGNAEEREYGCARLRAGCRSGGPLEARAAVMSLLGTLRVEEEDDVRAEAIRVLGFVAPRMEGFAERLRDIVEILVEQIVSDDETFRGPAREALLAIENEGDEPLAPCVLDEAQRAEDVRIRAFLLGLLSACAVPEALRARARTMIADCLLELPAESGSSHILGSFLVDARDEGASEILERIGAADVAHQRFFVRLLDHAVRFRPLADETLREIAVALHALLRGGTWNLRAEIFETRAVTNAAMDVEQRRETAAELLRDLRQYGLPQIHELVESALTRLGPDAAPVMLDVAREHEDSVEGRVACGAVGRMALEADMEDEAVRGVFREALRALQGLTFSEGGRFREVFIAMGRICSRGVFDEDVRGVIRRNLLNRLSGDAGDAPLIEALGLFVSAPGEPEETLETVAKIALALLERDVDADMGAMSRGAAADGEDVFILGDGFDIHSDLIPAALEACVCVILSASAPEEMRVSVCRSLLEKWRACVSYRVQWSPANVTLLTRALGRVGAEPGVPQPLRREIIRALAKRRDEIPVLEALADILAVDLEDPELDRLAAAMALRTLETMRELRDITAEDREIYLGVLGRVAMRGTLAAHGGKGGQIMDRVVEELVAGLRAGVPGCLRRLADLRDNARVDAKVRSRIDETVRLYTSLAPR